MTEKNKVAILLRKLVALLGQFYQVDVLPRTSLQQVIHSNIQGRKSPFLRFWLTENMKYVTSSLNSLKLEGIRHPARKDAHRVLDRHETGPVQGGRLFFRTAYRQTDR